MKMNEIDSIVFDLDRTLIDITYSYEQAIKNTVSDYLYLLGIKTNKEKLIPSSDIYQLFWKPELADVWYLTYVGIQYYLGQINQQNPDVLFERRESGIKNSLREEINSLKQIKLNSKKIKYNFSGFSSLLLKSKGKNYAEVIENALTEKFENTEINKLWYKELAQMIFQANFLGFEKYKEEYGFEPPIEIQKGLFIKDKPIPNIKETKKVLQFLSSKYKLGIATARPKTEAFNALELFDYFKFFNKKAIFCLEDGSKTKRIINSLKVLGSKKSIYVGDAIGDAIAVKELQQKGIDISFFGVNVSGGSSLMKEQKQKLKEAGATIVLDDFSKIMEAIK